MHAEQPPGQIAIACFVGADSHHHRRAAGAAMRARVGEEIALAVEAQPEGRGDHRPARHGQMMQRVVEAEGKADHQDLRANLDAAARRLDVFRREGAKNRRFGQRASVDLDGGDVGRAGPVEPLPPQGRAVAIQRDREGGGFRHIFRVNMQFNHDPVGEMPRRLVDQHMSARHQKQPRPSLEEKSARIGERPLVR